MKQTQIALSDGVYTHLTDFSVKDHERALLCVHGMTSSRMGWKRFAQRFSKTHRVYAYDQRGHGDMAHVHGPMSLDQADDDLRAVVASIDGPIDALVGHSWGGAVVIRGGRTTRAQRVIAVDPMIAAPPDIDWNGEFIGTLEQELALPTEELHALYRRRYAVAGYSQDDVEGKLHAITNMSVEPIKRLKTENNVEGGGWDLRELLRAYPKPMLLCLADPADSVVLAPEREFVERHGGPLITAVDYPGQGHSLHRTDFERFSEDVERFLSDAII